MRIEQEDFDSLNQLDRIEYRQVADRIEKDYISNFTVTYLFCLGIFSILFLCFLILLKELNYDGFLILVIKLKMLLKFGYVLLVLTAISDFYHIFKRRKLMEELDSKYFKHELKKKK